MRTWYLIATVGAGDDVNTTNDVGLSGGTAVNPPSIDYSPSPATNTGGSSGGGPLTGTFTIHNNGTANGSASVTWTAYLSSDAALDITDQVIGTGSIAALGALATSGPIGFAGTWPVGTATWYLIVKVSAADDVSAANDASVPTAVPVTGVTPAYTITAVPVPVGSTTGQAVSGTFAIKNTGSAAGSAAVNWQAFASLDAVYNTGDILIASGSLGGLGIGASSSPGYAGTWPSTPGTWYIIVRASAADAPPVPDAPSPAVLVSIPPQPNYTVSFNAAIPWSGLVGTAMSSTGTCQITINNVSATNTGLSNVNWSVYWSTDNILDGGDTLIQQGSIRTSGRWARRRRPSPEHGRERQGSTTGSSPGYPLPMIPTR